MAKYLFHNVDENICLYRGFKFFDTRFDEKSMTLIDLDTFCDELPYYDGSEKNFEACYNFLRFTDQDNPQKLKDFYNQIDCK